MAYTQKPGRGNNAKTGHGVPTPFMQTKPDYAKADRQEKESGYGASSAAAGILKGYPQFNNLKGINSKVAGEQIQITRDSLNQISGAKNDMESKKLGKQFFDNYSTNNPKVKARLAKSNNEGISDYQGVGPIGTVTGKGSGSQEAKTEVLGKLVAQGAKTFGQSDDSGMPNFGIPKIGINAKTNPKNPVAKQMRLKAKGPVKMKKC
jgi:hypothetical protein